MIAFSRPLLLSLLVLTASAANENHAVAQGPLFSPANPPIPTAAQGPGQTNPTSVYAVRRQPSSPASPGGEGRQVENDTLVHDQQAPPRAEIPQATNLVFAKPPIIDPHVQVATHVAGTENRNQINHDNPSRRLLTPSRGANKTTGRHSPLEKWKLPELPGGSTTTTVAAMSLVMGLFFLSIWVVKRSVPQSAKTLPDEVVTVLGRRQITPRLSAQMLRVGNKLVLVSVTPETTETITEITDPLEVSRLLGLCTQAGDASSTQEFQDVLSSMAQEPATPGFLGAESRLMKSATAGSYLS